MLSIDEKNKIIEAARGWLERKNVSQQKLATDARVNSSYLSSMMNGVYHVKGAGDAVTEIADQWFIRIAQTIGYSDKPKLWPKVQTAETERIFTALRNAKEKGTKGAIICKTGMGKTYNVGLFLQQVPRATFKITVNNLFLINDVLDELMQAMGQPKTGRNNIKLARAITVLREMKRKGDSPIVIIDEAENLTLKMLQSLKGLIDGVADYASVMLIGTPQLLGLLDKLVRRDANGMPQFVRRIKSGIRDVSSKELDFKVFYEALGISDKGLKRLCKRMCDNYGELQNYLEPVLQEAYEQGVPPTATMMAMIHDLVLDDGEK